ncbi:MAG: M16 family metallopeptidase, partial [Phycisphaerales bacterium]
FTLTLPESAGAPTESELVALGTEALNVRPDPVVETARATDFMEKAPTPGKVVESAAHAATAVTSGWLENGLRVHHRFMDTRKDTVTISITLAGGVINESADNRGISQAAQVAWNPRTMATRGFTSSQVRDLLTGKKVNVGGGAGGMIAGLTGGAGTDTLAISVSGSPEDLATGLKLAHLLLTQPKLEAAALEKWKQQQKQFVFARSLAPQGVLIESLSEAVYPAGDTRLRPLTVAQIDAVTTEAAQSWLDAFVAAAPIEVAVVGDIPETAAMDLVTTYLGSLPKRARVTPTLFADRRSLARPATPPVVDRSMVSKTDQAQVVAGFFGVDGTNVRDVRLMELAAATITSRMVKVIREEKQLVYSIGARNQPSDVYPGFGMFMAMAPTKPGKGEELTQAVYAIFDEFAKSGPTAEELDVAKKQQANTLDDAIRDPGYWTGRLATLDLRGRKLDDVAESMAAYEAFTTEDVKGAFGRYNVPGARFTVRVTPQPPTDQADGAAPPAKGGN